MTEVLWVGRFVGRGGRWSAITPNQHGIRRCAATQQLQAEAFLALYVLLGEPAIEPDVPFPALECCQVSTNGVSLIPTLELTGNSVDSLHHPWIFISKSWVCRHGECQTLETARQSTACR